MPLSFRSPDAQPTGVEILLRAFELGLTLVDTADVYAPSANDIGHNERIVGEAVRLFPSGRDTLRVVTKVGLRRHGNDWWRDSSPEWLLSAAERSVAALGLVPDMLLLHRVNREQSFAAAIEGLLEARRRGLAKHIGLSNVTLGEFNDAWALTGGRVCAVQNEFSPRCRDQPEVLRACSERGVPFLAWSPLGGGHEAARLGELYPVFGAVAAERGTTPQAVALAWLRAQGPTVVPIPAFGRFETLEATVAASGLTLSPEEMSRLDQSPAGPGSVFPPL